MGGRKRVIPLLGAIIGLVLLSGIFILINLQGIKANVEVISAQSFRCSGRGGAVESWQNETIEFRCADGSIWVMAGCVILN